MADEVKGFNIKLGLDSSQLSNGLKEVNNTLKSQEKELKKVNKELKYDPKNVELLKQKQEILNKSIAETTKKISELKAKAATLGNDVTSQKSILGQIDKAESSLIDLNGNLAKTKSQLNSLATEKWDSLSKVANSFTKISASVIAAGTAISAFTIKGAGNLATIFDEASGAGMDAENYQKIIDAATTLGVTSSQARTGITKLGAALGDLAVGEGLETAKTLKQIGLNYQDFIGLDTTTALKKISDAFQKISDRTTKLALANKLFGDRLGAQLLPLLEAGSDQIDDLMETATYATNEEVESSKALIKALDDVKTRFTEIAGTIASAVLPYVNQFKEVLTSDIVPKVREIIQGTAQWVSANKTLAKAILTITVTVPPLLSVVANLGKALSAVKIGTAGASSGLLGLVAAHPVVTAAIVGITALFTSAYKEDEKFKESIHELIDSLKTAFIPVINTVKEIFDSLKPIWNVLVDAFKIAADLILPPLTFQIKILGQAFEAIHKLFSPLLEGFSLLIEKIGSSTGLTRFMEGLANMAQFVGRVFDGLTKSVNEFFDGVNKFFNGDFSGFADYVKGYTNPTAPILIPSHFGFGATGNSNNNTYNVTINTTADHMSISEIDSAIGNKYIY